MSLTSVPSSAASPMAAAPAPATQVPPSAPRHRYPPGFDEHLSDRALAALLNDSTDGFGHLSVPWAHVDECTSCRARLRAAAEATTPEAPRADAPRQRWVDHDTDPPPPDPAELPARRTA